MNSSDNALLSVRHLSMYFGKGPYALKAVDDVSFDINKGEVFGLVGESGCGKTTTGRTIIRLYDATGGEVYFKGQRIVAGTLEYRKQINELLISVDGTIRRRLVQTRFRGTLVKRLANIKSSGLSI